ncbi:amine oxidase [Methylocella silvestris BL2]|uniref:Amine oxidase n=1 Tax=Methylocella silvestris (strain DSM 15510 / CIP 108128 / LMG 27833 / NCIMB 13906 / BL2) TaxID=395965 RepID=B8EPW1_METSB|nr:NAD/FAD-binding protein [Methylocella silvestris]ACK50965.1 amine oxidase [Methylocella silvestris BL2]
MTQGDRESGCNIAVIGTGISGMAAAWLLSSAHRVTMFERAVRPGGHSNTVDVKTASGVVPVDTGFIVYNTLTYPNLTALFDHIGVRTQPSEMSFAASLDGGRLEYSGGVNLTGLFAQPRNILSPRFWSMLRDLRRFYANAPSHLGALQDVSLGSYLTREKFGEAFRDDHILPMAAAIWSAPAKTMLDFPAEAFIKFFDNHRLLKLIGRPVWRTVAGGSRAYVERILRDIEVRYESPALTVRHEAGGVEVRSSDGGVEHFDRVVIAAHADDALAMLADPSAEERRLLGAFRYSANAAVLHTDDTLMPKRRKAWASWNYLTKREGGADSFCVTYWMNRLQDLPPLENIFVTLNPPNPPRPNFILHSEIFHHPVFDAAALDAQRLLWSLQGKRNIWFCGSYFGAGFHEDGLQAGLAVAEQIGGVRRPWSVPDESGRIPSLRLHDAETALQ